MNHEHNAILSELTSAEVAQVAGAGSHWPTIKPLEEGVYIDGVLVHMHAITLHGLLQSGVVSHVVTNGV